jgi:post-segregation antitoxin (ccd killing protein)
MSSWRLTTSGLRARPTWDRYVTGAGYFDVYSVRMARVNITIPDALYNEAKSAGLNISRVAQDAIRAELARLGKVAELDAYLAELEAELGPHSEKERAEAKAWADELFGPATHSRSA